MKALPKQTELDFQPITCDEDLERCNSCPLHKTLCGGCLPSGKRDMNSPNFCLQGGCMSACSVCGGARGAEVPAICCKSPTRDIAWPELSHWSDPAYRPKWWSKWADVPPLPLTQSAINISQHGGSSSTESPYLEDVEAWGISIRHLRGAKGWVTNDVKDYLNLPSHVKVIGLTTMKDDLLENYWEKDVLGGEEFERVGIDYWMPLMFSNYSAYGQMMNTFMAVRSLEAAVWGRSHFVPINWASGLFGYNLVIEAAQKVKNVVINSQFVRQTADNWRRKLQEIVRWHLILPRDVSFFLVGIANGSKIITLRQLLQDRRVYFMSSTPFLAGSRGRYYTKRGEDKAVSKDVPKHELIINNQKNFNDLAQREVPPLIRGQREWLDAQKKIVMGLQERNFVPR